jgi:hypothetical protein
MTGPRLLTRGVLKRLACDDESDFEFLPEHRVHIVCRSGLDRVLNYVSPSSLSVLGRKHEERAGRMADDFILAEELPFVAAANDTVIIRMRRKEGSAARTEDRARLVCDPATEN